MGKFSAFFKGKECSFCCKKKNPIFLRFCYYCGRRLPKKCRYGHLNEGDAKVCEKCKPSYKFPMVKAGYILFIFSDLPLTTISLVFVGFSYMLPVLGDINDLVIFFLMLLALNPIAWIIKFRGKYRKQFRTPLKLKLLIAWLGTSLAIVLYSLFNSWVSENLLWIYLLIYTLLIIPFSLLLVIMEFYKWMLLRFNSDIKNEIWKYTSIEGKHKKALIECKSIMEKAKLNPDSGYVTIWWGKKIVKYKRYLLYDILLGVVGGLSILIIVIGFIISFATLYIDNAIIALFGVRIDWFISFGITFIALLESLKASKKYKPAKKLPKKSKETQITTIEFFRRLIRNGTNFDLAWCSVYISALMGSLFMTFASIKIVMIGVGGVSDQIAEPSLLFSFVVLFSCAIWIYIHFIINLIHAIKNIIIEKVLIVKHGDILFMISASLPAFVGLYIWPFTVETLGETMATGILVIYFAITLYVAMNYIVGRVLRRFAPLKKKLMNIGVLSFLISTFYYAIFYFFAIIIFYVLMKFPQLFLKDTEKKSKSLPSIFGKIDKSRRICISLLIIFGLLLSIDVVFSILEYFLYGYISRPTSIIIRIIILSFLIISFLGIYIRILKSHRKTERQAIMDHYSSGRMNRWVAGVNVFWQIEDIKNKYGAKSEIYRKALKLEINGN